MPASANDPQDVQIDGHSLIQQHCLLKIVGGVRAIFPIENLHMPLLESSESHCNLRRPKKVQLNEKYSHIVLQFATKDCITN